MKWTPCPHVGGDEDLRLGRVGQHRAGGLSNGLAPVGLGFELVLWQGLVEFRDEVPVRVLRVLDCAFQNFSRLLGSGPVLGEGRRDDEVRLALVDEPLGTLAVGEAGAVPHQLVREGPRHPRHHKTIIHVLEYTAVALRQEVGDELLDVATAFAVAHVADPGRYLDNRGRFIVTRPDALRHRRHSLLVKKRRDRLPVHLGAGDQSHRRLGYERHALPLSKLLGR